MPEKSRLMPISYYNPRQEIRLSAYADTIVLESDGREQRLRAIRFGGYPEMVRAMSDAIYAGATLETEFAGETAMLTCEPKKYECHLSHDGIYAEATILSLDDADTAAKKDEDAQADGQTNVELPPRKCILFCPAGDRQALFDALDRKTAVPLIPEFQDYVLGELHQAVRRHRRLGGGRFPLRQRADRIPFVRMCAPKEKERKIRFRRNRRHARLEHRVIKPRLQATPLRAFSERGSFYCVNSFFGRHKAAKHFKAKPRNPS